MVERFRDEVGDWRVCVHTPLGGRVHAPLALALESRLQERLGIDARAMWTDDGIALHLPDVDAAPSLDELLLDPEEVEALVQAQLLAQRCSHPASARTRRARCCCHAATRTADPALAAAHAQRGLLKVAGQYPDFPILAETWRECMADHFDMAALMTLLRAIRSREVRVVAVDTERASPFASSLLFSYVAEYMYEGDSPLAERRAQALTLDRELLAELLGSEDLRELLDPEAIASVELELQGLLPERFPRDADEAHDLLVRLGDLSIRRRGRAASRTNGCEASRASAAPFSCGSAARQMDRRGRRRAVPRGAGGQPARLACPRHFSHPVPEPLECWPGGAREPMSLCHRPTFQHGGAAGGGGGGGARNPRGAGRDRRRRVPPGC